MGSIKVTHRVRDRPDRQRKWTDSRSGANVPGMLGAIEFVDAGDHAKNFGRNLQVKMLLQDNGWVVGRIKGSHTQMVKDGRAVTVPHPKKGPRAGLMHAILKQSGLK